jgi:hypothetical protein
MDKCKAMWIGASINFYHKPYGLKWTNKLVEILGIYISTDSQEITNAHFTEWLDKLQNLVELWCLRKLIFQGKVLDNTLLMTIMISHTFTPSVVILKYKEINLKFILRGKPAKVNYRTMINTFENGGITL